MSAAGDDDVFFFGERLHDEVRGKVARIRKVPEGEVKRPVTEVDFGYGKEKFEAPGLHLQISRKNGAGEQRNQTQLHVVTQADTESLRAGRWVKRLRRLESLAKLSKSRPDGTGEPLSPRGRHHALRGAHKQRICKACAQPCEGITEGRLTQANAFCSPAHMPLVQQRLEGEQ
jgi:hypothetical protein